MRLSQILIERGVLDVEALKRAEEVHTRTGYGLAHVLVRAGMLDARALLEIVSEATGVPAFDPARFRPEPVDVQRLPFALASRRRALVVGPKSGGGGFYVAFSDPTDRLTAQVVGQHLKAALEPLLVDEITLERGLEHFYGRGTQPSQTGAPESLEPEDGLPGDFGVGEIQSFLTESTDEALRTYLEPLAARPQGSPPDDQDIEWLKAKHSGAYAPPGRLDLPRSAIGDGFEMPGNTVIQPLPGELTVPASEPLMTGLDVKKPDTPDSSGVPDHLHEMTLDSAIEFNHGPPTIVDEQPPEHDSSGEETP